MVFSGKDLNFFPLCKNVVLTLHVPLLVSKQRVAIRLRAYYERERTEPLQDVSNYTQPNYKEE